MKETLRERKQQLKIFHIPKANKDKSQITKKLKSQQQSDKERKKEIEEENGYP